MLFPQGFGRGRMTGAVGLSTCGRMDGREESGFRLGSPVTMTGRIKNLPAITRSPSPHSALRAEVSRSNSDYALTG